MAGKTKNITCPGPQFSHAKIQGQNNCHSSELPECRDGKALRKSSLGAEELGTKNANTVRRLRGQKHLPTSLKATLEPWDLHWGREVTLLRCSFNSYGMCTQTQINTNN